MNGPRTQASRGCAEAGFTLLELLIALAIMAGMLVLAVPRVGGAISHIALHSTAMQLAAELRLVRSAAIWSNTETGLSIDLARRQYWADGRVGVRTIPAEIGVELAGAVFEDASPAARRVHFFPDGSGDAASITLNDGGQRTSVTVDGLTGAIQVTRSR